MAPNRAELSLKRAIDSSQSTTYLADLNMAITDQRATTSSTQLSITAQTLSRRVVTNNATIGACRPGQFRCHNGRCIPERWVCNHHQDCPAAEDEPARCRESRSTAAKTPPFYPEICSAFARSCLVLVEVDRLWCIYRVRVR